MRKALLIVLAAAALFLIAGVFVFRYSMGLPWLDAVYFVVTTMTTVGYGDINLQAAPGYIKLFGNFLMVAGAASLAALFGIITDTILHSRLQEFFGRRKCHMKNHIVLCGLGNVGYRVLKFLNRMGEVVVVVEKDPENKFVSSARDINAQVIFGDIRLPSTLEQADVKEARCLIAVSDEDLANLEAALNAKSLNENIHIVLRLFDQNLANKIRSGFGIQTAFSTSALSAPAFAMAAVDPSVIGSFFVGDDLMLNLEIAVTAGSELEGMTTKEFEKAGRLSILAHDSSATGKRELHPSEAIDLSAGDKIVVSILFDFIQKIHQMNTPRTD